MTVNKTKLKKYLVVYGGVRKSGKTREVYVELPPQYENNLVFVLDRYNKVIRCINPKDYDKTIVKSRLCWEPTKYNDTSGIDEYIEMTIQ